jgi:UDP-N-acetylmuramoylalanine--D-glutamate ligase
MNPFANKRAVVVGPDASGTAACTLLKKGGAEVCAVTSEVRGTSQIQTAGLKALGVRVLSPGELEGKFDLVVHSSLVSRKDSVVTQLLEEGVLVISDLELAARGFYCLSIGICGTNGKTTTAELVAEMLTQSQRKTIRAGASGEPVCNIVEQSRELDFLTLDLNSFQLESIEHFRPAVAVITNLRSDHLDQYATLSEYVRAVGSIFRNQQVFDWAIIQSEALAHLRSLDVPIPSKVIAFSANNRRADIYLDRGLLISALPNWSGPLFNTDQCALRGPHNAENIMAALAVGHVLRLPLEEMTVALRGYRPGPHRLEMVGETGGVRFVNNSKAMNVDAVAQSIDALPPGRGGEPNIWLIAGGKDKALDYHDLGPLLARRVKGAFLLGESREKLRAAWSLFTPCTLVDSLLEAVTKAAESAEQSDYVLLSPACSSFDMFQNYQHRGEVFREAVREVAGAAEKKSRAQNTANYSVTH